MDSQLDIDILITPSESELIETIFGQLGSDDDEVVLGLITRVVGEETMELTDDLTAGDLIVVEIPQGFDEEGELVWERI